MKMTKALVTVALVAAFAFLAFAMAGAGEDVPTLTDESFVNPQRPAALFDHDQHMDLYADDCSVCHHVYENGVKVEGESSEDQACSDCHSLKGSKDNSMPLMRAYHVNCVGCHEAEKKGPVMCGECHRK